MIPISTCYTSGRGTIKISWVWPLHYVTISCQPDGRPPQPVRPWKNGRVHLAERSNAAVLELPYSTEFGRESRKFASGVRKYEKLMTVVDRLDELQASSVGRRECSSTRQRTGARRMDVNVDTYSQPCPRATGCGHCPGTCHGGLARYGVCAWSCCHLANGNKRCPRPLFTHDISF